MRFVKKKNYYELSQYTAKHFVQTIKATPSAIVCLASGNTPLGAYSLLQKQYSEHSSLFDRIRVIKLDEWVGIPLSSTASCEYYLRQNVIQPFEISEDRFISFESKSNKVQYECDRIKNFLYYNGPIDLCILGIGRNGHIGLIEPTSTIGYHPHAVKLSRSTKSHSMLKNIEEKPNIGITLGIGDIFASKKILLLVNGKSKKEVLKKIMKMEISTKLPASLLWLHPNTTIIYDDEALHGL